MEKKYLKKPMLLNTTIGADPELVIVRADNNVMVEASEVLNDPNCSAPFGVDGCHSIAELRPLPQLDIRDSVFEMGRMLAVFNKRTHGEYKLLSGHYPRNHAIGGHIHIGLTPKERQHAPRSRVYSYADESGDNFKSQLIRNLDAVFYDVVIPLLDDTPSVRARQRGNYGHRGAYEDKCYGIEYRTCGSFLVSPAITLVFLGLAKMTYQATRLDIPTGRNSLANFHRFLAAFPYYTPDVKHAIKVFQKMLPKLREQAINWNTDILENWGIKPAKNEAER
jgi:hypothetical protein